MDGAVCDGTLVLSQHLEQEDIRSTLGGARQYWNICIQSSFVQTVLTCLE